MNEEDIFLNALDLESADERSAYLDKACGRETPLRHRLEGLLKRHGEASRFLEQPAVEVMAEELGSETLNAPHSTVAETIPQTATPDLDFLGPSENSDALGRLGQYEILEVVGWGGMGIVLKAQDTRLNRIVAVKVLAPELASNPTARKRFSREAQAVAAITHDHVVTIHAVHENHESQAGQLPYLVMEFIDGESLQERINREGHLELKEILRIGRQIATGLAAAHQQGLIHRDVKPSNVLLQNGVQRVQLTDFGLARAVDDAGMTHPGEVTGTPQYMSPEQAQGNPVDARSDLFSLGSVLYAMCTGRSPFRADTSMASLRRVCDDTPRPISEINSEIPDWLISIIDRLLQKDAESRFQSAEEVAALLEKHLAHLQDPGSSPFPGTVPAIPRRPANRRRQRWLMAGLVLVGLCASLGVTEATGVTNFSATVIRIVSGEGTLVIEVDDPNVSVAIDGADIVITGAGPKEVRLTPGNYKVTATKDGRTVKQELVTITRGDRRVVRVVSERPSESAIRPESATLAELRRRVEKTSASNPFDSELVKLRQELVAFRHEHYADPEAIEAAQLMSRLPWPVDVLNRKDIEARELKAAGNGDAKLAPQELVAVLGQSAMKHWQITNAVAFSSDGERLFSASWNGVVREWNALTGEAVAPVEIVGHYSTRVAFSPDRSRLATSTGTLVTLWDRESKRSRQLPDVHRVETQGLAFSHDGAFVASVGWDGTVCLIDFALGKVERRFHGHTGPVIGVAFSPDNKSIASSGDDGTVRLWSLEGGDPVLLRGHEHQKHAVAFSPSGDRIAAVSRDGVVEIWDAATGKRLHEMQAESGFLWVMGVRFSPDGKTLAASGKKSVNIWDVESGSLHQRLTPCKDTIALDFSPDGSKLAATAGERVVVWDLKSGKRLQEFGAAYNPSVTSIAVAPDGQQIAAATRLTSAPKGVVRLWDLKSGEVVRDMPEQAEDGIGINRVAYLAGGHGLAMAHCNGDVTFWDAATDRIRKAPPMGMAGQAFALAASPVDQVIAAYRGYHVEVWDAKSLTLKQSVKENNGSSAVAFTTDGGTFVVGSADGLIKAWSVATGELVQTFAGHKDQVRSVAVSPDGGQLASVGFDQQVRLWDLKTGRLRFSLPNHLTAGSPNGWGQSASVAFSPDGTLLASSAYDGTVRLWDPRDRSQKKAIKICPAHGLINEIVFTPDGRHLLTANGNGTVYVLRLVPRPNQTNKNREETD